MGYCLPDSSPFIIRNPETSSRVTLAALGIVFQTNLLTNYKHGAEYGFQTKLLTNYKHGAEYGFQTKLLTNYKHGVLSGRQYRA